ncbi:MAG: NlpC/P60 family protein [Pseudomonadota bacterium]
MAETFQIQVPAITMRIEPDENAESSNTLIFGERVTLLKELDEWAHVRADHDGYTGYIPISVLGDLEKTQHTVSVPLTHIYEDPDFKSQIFSPLYMGSKLASSDETQNGFRALVHGGWVFDAHLRAKGERLTDIVETALMFKDSPYLWGGRTAAGIDCSGLVQIALMAASMNCPRDTKDQIDSIGQSVEFGDTIQYAQLQGGDLVYFKGHVGIMVDGDNILNATSRHMRTVIEPLDDVVKAYEGILSVRRL